MIQSESTEKILTALAKAQGECGAIAKGGQNDFHKYSYATLENYLDVAKPVLRANGLSLVEGVISAKELQQGRMLVELEVILLHESGEWIRTTMFGEGQDVASKSDRIGDKALYKAITGARKYAVASLLNLTTSDDPEKDSATHKGKEPYPKKALMENGSEMQYIKDVFVAEVREKEFYSKKAKKNMTGYAVMIGGEPYNTTKEVYANIAREACETGTAVGVEFRPSEYEGYDLLGIIQL